MAGVSKVVTSKKNIDMPYIAAPKPVHILYDLTIGHDFRTELLKKFREYTSAPTTIRQTALNDYVHMLLPEPKKHVVGCAVVGTHISIRIHLKEWSVGQAEKYIIQVRQKLLKL